jgi:capsular polysaccharide biosynthesis protein
MELNKFLNILKRNKFTIAVVPVVAIVITYFLTKNQPNVYSSHAKIATGIVDQTQKIFADGANTQESRISQEFANLVEMLKSKKILDQVSYSLMIHDLTSKYPYRQPSKLFNELNANARNHALQTFRELYSKRLPLSLTNPDQNGLHSLLASMKYDDQSLLKNLTIYRVQNTDYIDVQFDSERSDLSAIVTNNVCAEFIDYYTYLVKESQRKAVDFWGNLLRAKEDTLNRRMATLKAYKIRNHVLNLNEKAKSIYGQITDFETRREDIEKSVDATQAAINHIDKQFDPKDRKYVESSKVEISQAILNQRAELEKLNNEYVQRNFDPAYKSKIDSVSTQLSNNIEKLSDYYILNPMNSKKDLIQQKMALQVQNDLAKNSTKAVNNELRRLNQEFDSVVPHEGTIQAYESAISVASQEYLEILEKYNQSNVISKGNIQLKIIEIAEPGMALPSKKMLFVVLSGIVSLIFCIAVFFITYLFDSTLKSARDLANKTKLPVLGHINFVKGKALDLKAIWDNLILRAEVVGFKNLMQSLRYEVANELGEHKVLLVNSVRQGEGKTFIAINLAYAFSTINKRVLLIDGNFNNSSISANSNSSFYLEDFINGSIAPAFFTEKSPINVLCLKGKNGSLFELGKADVIQAKMELLKSTFDIIIIETSALDTLHQSKEWISFADKIITVFESGQKLTDALNQQIGYLKSLNEKFAGWVLNMEQPELPKKIKKT